MRCWTDWLLRMHIPAREFYNPVDLITNLAPSAVINNASSKFINECELGWTHQHDNILLQLRN